MTSKVPMALAAQNLEQICNALDEEEINATLKLVLTETRLDLVNAIDRRICLLELTEERIKTCKRLRDEFNQAAKRMEYVVERVKESTMNVMESYPELPYKGELGRLRLQNNSSAKIFLPGILTGDYSVRNVIDAADIKKHAISEEYYEVRTYYTLVIDTIKKAIESGKDIPWATLERGKHLRVSR